MMPSIRCIMRTFHRRVNGPTWSRIGFGCAAAVRVVSTRSCQQQRYRRRCIVEPIVDAERLHERLQVLVPSMASSLASVGYWTNNLDDDDDDEEKELVVGSDEVQAMRDQAIALRTDGRFEQSLSETTSSTGEVQEFPKEGVLACEPDGRDYDTAPDMLIYMSTLIRMLPPLLNDAYNQLPEDVDDESSSSSAAAAAVLTLTNQLSLSNQAFNAKLAVTSPGGSVYPLHVDNTLGVRGSPQDDTRKLTFILYLNPNHDQYVDGGQLRLVVGTNDGRNNDDDDDEMEVVDLDPVGGRVVVFWSDEIPHEVLPCALGRNKDDSQYDRYALTVWIPDVDPRNIQPPNSKFQTLREHVF